VETGGIELLAEARSFGLLSIQDIPEGGFAGSYLLYRNAFGILRGISALVSVGSGDGAPAGTTWKSFKDPVNPPTTTAFAFAAQLKGATTADDDGLWWKPESGSLQLVARENGQPPQAPAGAQWKSFSSLALPGSSGPLFTAMLRKNTATTPGSGGITSVDDFGLYGVDRFGVLRELVRENQPLLGKTVKTFNVLKAVSGTVGSSRSFNGTGETAVLVTFTDKTSAIVKITGP
jgi:hypothetical protein